jgi:hypothetical protein
MKNNNPLIKSILRSYNLDYMNDEDHGNHVLDMLNKSEIVKKLRDADYYLTDDDRLAGNLYQYSQSIDDQPLETLNVYRHRMLQTQSALMDILILINEELRACDRIDANINEIAEDTFKVTDDFLKTITNIRL